MIPRLFTPLSTASASTSSQPEPTNDDNGDVDGVKQEVEKVSNSLVSVERVSGSFYTVTTSSDEPTTPSQQPTCIFVMCEVFVRPAIEHFTFELVIVRTDDENENENVNEEEEQPSDMIFTIDKSSSFLNESNQFTMYDRTGKKYILDIDDESSSLQLNQSISIALYQKLYSSLPSKQDEEDMKILNSLLSKPIEPTPEDLLVSKGELLRVNVELLKFEQELNDFLPVIPSVIATINSAIIDEDTGKRVYVMALYLPSSGELIFEVEINNSLNSQFFTTLLRFVWFMAKDGDVDVEEVLLGNGDISTVAAFAIRLESDSSFVEFRNQFSLCLYEVNQNASVNDLKLKDSDIEYIQNSARDDIDMMDVAEQEGDVEEEEIPERERNVKDARNRASLGEPNDGLENSQLAIASHHDRTFVVRGNKMGVFQTGDEGAEWKTTINFKNNDKSFKPSKVLLHRMDNSMLLLDSENDKRIMRMDLERGEIVDTWSGELTANTPINQIHQTSKYAHRTDEQDFIGLNKNQILKMDPRTQQLFVQSKKYASGTRARLECIATTGNGYLAAASENGDIRLFDQIGKNAKTHLPGLGDKIIGIDVTEDGHFILATTEKYLLLIDSTVQGQVKDGFQKSMGKNKPKPRKLTITNNDLLKHRMGKIMFTTAHFNTGSKLEKSIVTSTGPFIVIWNFRQVKMGKVGSYTIKRYQDNVVADNFPFDNDGRIVVTLPNDVSVAKR